MTHRHHDHSHPHSPQLRATPSILRLSAAERLGAAAVMVAALWGVIFWAMT